MKRERIIKDDDDTISTNDTKRLKTIAISTDINDNDEEMITNGILSLVNKRDKTCWPSEVPRLHLKLSNWREYLQLTRKISIQLANDDVIEVCQKGITLSKESLLTCKGPIRLRRKTLVTI